MYFKHLKNNVCYLYPLLCWGVVWLRSVHAVTATVSSCVQLPSCAQKTLLPYSLPPSLAFTLISTPSSALMLSPGR